MSETFEHQVEHLDQTKKGLQNFRPLENSSTQLKISVVILTKGDNSKFLRDSIESLTRQTILPNKVILICDKKDSIIETLINQYKSKLLIVEIINEKPQGIGISRNAGISYSEEDIVAFLDDDAIASKKWIEGMQEAYLNQNVVAVSGKVVDKSPNLPPIISLINRRFNLGLKMVTTTSLIGCNMSFRKDFLEKIGAFNVTIDYGFDELEIADRIIRSGRTIIYSPKATVKHDYARSWKNLLWKTYRQGRGSVEFPLTYIKEQSIQNRRKLVYPLLKNGSLKLVGGILILYFVRRIGIFEGILRKKFELSS